jgi:hypothetical protein
MSDLPSVTETREAIESADYDTMQTVAQAFVEGRLIESPTPGNRLTELTVTRDGRDRIVKVSAGTLRTGTVECFVPGCEDHADLWDQVKR